MKTDKAEKTNTSKKIVKVSAKASNGKHKKNKKQEYKGFDENWYKDWHKVSEAPKNASETVKTIVRLFKKTANGKAVIMQKGSTLRLRKDDATLIQLKAISQDVPTLVMQPKLRGQDFKVAFPGMNRKAWTFNDMEHSEYRYQGEDKKLLMRVKKIVPILIRHSPTFDYIAKTKDE